MNIEEFVNDYLQEHRHDVLLSPYNGLIDFTNALKEQMLKEAVDGEVVVPLYEGRCEGNDIWSTEIKIPGRYEIGDKVRIIIIEEDR